MAKKKKVLIMDDKRETIVFLANKILRPGGYSIITAMDGEKGLSKALEEKPDLIIMDLKMPRMTGLEVLEALREKGYDTPAIVMTFHGSEAAAVQAFRLGAKDYIIKPFTVEEMQTAIARALQEEKKSPLPESDWEKDELLEVNDLLQRSIDELSALHDVGRALASILDLEKVLSLAVETAIPLAEAEEGSLFLVDEKRGNIYLSAVQGSGDGHAHVCREKTSDDLISQVVRTGEVVTISRFLGEEEQRTMSDKNGDYSLMAVPMKIEEKIIGVLAVKSTAPDKDFTDNDGYLLSILADYTAISTKNSRLYGEAQFEIERVTKVLTTEEEDIQDNRDNIESQISRMEAEQLARQLRALTLAAERLAQRLQAR